MLIRFSMVGIALVLVILTPFHFGFHQSRHAKALQLSVREILLAALVVVIGTAWAVNAERSAQKTDMWQSRAETLRRRIEAHSGDAIFVINWKDDGVDVETIIVEGMLPLRQPLAPTAPTSIQRRLE